MYNFNTTNPTQTDVSADYLLGKARNITVAGDNTGTPWNAFVANNLLFGPLSAILSEAGLTPNNTDEKIGQSQVLDALKVIAYKQQTIRCKTLTEAIAEDAPVGTRYIISDLSNARYDGVEGADTGGFYKTGLASGRKLKYIKIIYIKISELIEDYNATNTEAVQYAASSGAYCLIDRSVMSDSVTLSSGTTFAGGGELIFNGDNSTIKNFIVLSTGSTLDNIKIKPFHTDAEFTHPDDDYDSPDRNFSYINNIIAVGSAGNQEDLKILNCTISGFWRGIGGNGDAGTLVNMTKIVNCGEWQTQFYNCSNLNFSQNKCLYGGKSGGVAASSCKNSTFTANIIIASGTGINTGGSNLAGLNAENITIVGNSILARDCVNLENGINGAVVSGNYCTVFENKDLPGTTGVGIAATSNSGLVAAGIISDVTITGNTIKAYSRNFAYGVLVRSTATDYSGDFDNVTVSSNTIRGANFGVEVSLNSAGGSKIYNADIIGNTIDLASSAIVIGNVYSGNVRDNSAKQGGTAPVTGQYGIRVTGEWLNVSGNTLCGFGTSVLLNTGCNAIYLNENTNTPHTISGTQGVDYENNTTSYFTNDIAGTVVTDTGNRLIINSKFVSYEPASSHVINGLVGGYVKSSEVVTVKFNGNTTLQNSTNLQLLNGENTAPPSGARVQFVSTKQGRLMEVFRSY